MVFTDEMLARAAREVDMAILASLPDEKDCNYTFSPAFERKMKKVIRRADHPFVYHTLRRAACILIAFLTAASLILAFNSDARAAIANWVQDKVNEFYHYFFVGGENDHEPSEPGETEENVDASDSHSSASYCLGWVPDGYVLVNSFAYETGKTLVYSNDSRQIMQFAFLYGSDAGSVYAGFGEYEQKPIAMDNLNADILIPKDPARTGGIIWVGDSGDIIFCISGFLTEDEFIDAALSLTVEKNN